jgi:hypothetical protein
VEQRIPKLPALDETEAFDALLETLAEMVERDTSADMIDSTAVRAHHYAIGLKKGIKRSRGSGGRAAASSQAPRPMRWLGSAAWLCADAGAGA